MDDIEKIEREMRDGLEGVTPGPWKHVCPDRGYCIDYIVTENPEAKDDQRHSDYIAETGNVTGPRGVNFFEKDAAHIARCDPENIRALLDELSRLTEVERRAVDDIIAVYDECAEVAVPPAKSLIGQVQSYRRTIELLKLRRARALSERSQDGESHG